MAMTLTLAKTDLMARHVMRHWVKKGRVTRLRSAPCKAGCACGGQPDDVHEWAAP